MRELGRTRLGLLAAILALTAVAGVLRYADTALVALFFVSLAALAGLAWTITFSTEALSTRIGPAATGVLQATLGNIPELSVVLFALNAGELVVAQTSLLGALFSNALLILGLAIVVGAWRSPNGVMEFRARLPNDTATLLLLAIFIIVLLGFSDQVGSRVGEHAVENAVAVTSAAKGENDLAVSVVKNAVSQTAVVVFPLLVLLSLFFAEPLTFVLDPIYIAALFLTAISLWQITGDGRAVAFEGYALIALFGILATITWSQ